MKRYLSWLLPLFAIPILLFSCQRELFFETLPSAGSLLDSSGNCLPKTVNGTYAEGYHTNDSNFINVAVHVTRPGAFSVTTNTVNGYSFSATGSFADTGINSVKLTAAGTPVNAGINVFTVSYDSSQCLIRLVVQPLGNNPAVYTLQGAPDTCYPVNVAGTYITDVSLNNQDSITLSLMVTVAGTWSINTNEVNRYKFYGSGVVGTGLQKITLKGIGTPLNSGTDIFTVTAGGSSCTFAVNVTKPVITTGTDYFPLTAGSYWTYDDLMNIGDTIKRVVTDSAVTNGIQYRIMHEYDRYGGDTALYFRRTGNDYIQRGPVDMLTLALKYVPEVTGEIRFLQQNLLSGDSWKSDEYVGTLFSGQPVYLQYNFFCVDANAAITVNGNSFINVYHIVMLPQVRSSQVNPFNSTSESIHLYYAKGIGLVYLTATDNMGFRKKEYKIRYWNIH